MPTIDLNADLGEGDGPGASPVDAELLRLATSANIACGGHAGSPSVMRATVTLAARHGVAIGAHPGYPDREGFGRRELGLAPAEVRRTVVGQISALARTCDAAGARLRYVKPHGALYNRAVRDAACADALVTAIRQVDPRLVLLALPGSALTAAASRAGTATAAEAFVDRAYLPDGSLVPRSEPGAVLDDVAALAERALTMVTAHAVTARDGSRVAIDPRSLCVHGDGANAAALLAAVRTRLERAGVVIAPFAP
ncbi:MAG TPA: 5-oxoprolinase subunit PxpA [Gemmatimonadales bacterium]